MRQNCLSALNQKCVCVCVCVSITHRYCYVDIMRILQKSSTYRLHVRTVTFFLGGGKYVISGHSEQSLYILRSVVKTAEQYGAGCIA